MALISRYWDDLPDIRSYLMGEDNEADIAAAYTQLVELLERLRDDLRLDDVTDGQWSSFFTHLQEWSAQLRDFVQGQALDIDFFR